MTPGTIEREFSELLKSQRQEEFPINMGLEAPLFSLLHPKVLWARLHYQHNPGQEISYQSLYGWHFVAFRNFQEALLHYPDVELQFEGRPWTLFKFLQAAETEAIIDFGELGSVVISRKEFPHKSRNELWDHVLLEWLSYALSPELWGPVGKWTRFHERLDRVFRNHDLLSGEDAPGYYPLKSHAEKLKDWGFIGTNLEKTYLLVVPWTFSLSALNKLEEVIQREY
jgi:hypothetical protein